MTNQTRRDKGVTLVEVMIASVVLVLSLIGLLFVITYSSRQNQINKEVQIAQRAAQSIIEAMSSKPFDEIFGMFNDYKDDLVSPMGYGNGESGLDAFLAKAHPGSWFDVELTDLGDDEVLAKSVRTPKLTPPAKGEDPTMPGFTRPHCGKIIFPGDDLATDEDGKQLLENSSDWWTANYWNQILQPSNKTFPMKLDMDGNGKVDDDVDMAGPPDTGGAKVRYRTLPVIVEVKWKGLAGVQSVVMHTFIFDRYNKWMTAQ